MNIVFDLDFTGALVSGLIFIAAAVFVLLSIKRVRRSDQAAHLKWLVPLAIYTLDQSLTYAVTNFYTLIGATEPKMVSAVITIMDGITMLAFLWALIVLWRMIRNEPKLLQTPWLNRGATPEGVWPPAPKA